MSDIAVKVCEAKKQIAKAAEAIVRCNEALAKLQASCKHAWRFVEQINDHHEHFWNITYKCVACDVLKTDVRKPPVCEDCNSMLVRAKKNDRQATRALEGKERNFFSNPPLAFRCSNPTCKKIHILWHLGD